MNYSNIALSLNSLASGYNDKIILNNISMKIERGEIAAIMGCSGSGKTTLLRTIIGQIPIQKGDIYMLEKNISTISRKELQELRKNLGVLFQHGALFSDLNVFENVAFPLRELSNIPNSNIINIVLEKLNNVGLKGAAHLQTNKISGGMAKRVALARAMVLNPKIMLYDEPFSGLDPISTSIIADLIKTFSEKTGCASLLITHNVRETFKIADNVYVINNGSIALSGKPKDLLDSNNEYAKQFIHGQTDGPIAFHFPETEEYKQWLKKQGQKV